MSSHCFKLYGRVAASVLNNLRHLYLQIGVPAFSHSILCKKSQFTVNFDVGKIYFSSTSLCLSENDESKSEINQEEEPNKRKIDPEKDRSKIIPPEVSIKYMESTAYKETYGDDPVWKTYFRNFKGGRPPSRTRNTCIRGKRIATGSPCPICRDEYLVPHYTNTKLLEQFIHPSTGTVYPAFKTGLCRKKQYAVLAAVMLAKDYGLIRHDVPQRIYDYSEYYKDLKIK